LLHALCVIAAGARSLPGREAIAQLLFTYPQNTRYSLKTIIRAVILFDGSFLYCLNRGLTRITLISRIFEDQRNGSLHVAAFFVPFTSDLAGKLKTEEVGYLWCGSKSEPSS
jgi:hypothetical protein